MARREGLIKISLVEIFTHTRDQSLVPRNLIALHSRFTRIPLKRKLAKFQFASQFPVGTLSTIANPPIPSPNLAREKESFVGISLSPCNNFENSCSLACPIVSSSPRKKNAPFREKENIDDRTRRLNLWRCLINRGRPSQQPADCIDNLYPEFWGDGPKFAEINSNAICASRPSNPGRVRRVIPWIRSLCIPPPPLRGEYPVPFHIFLPISALFTDALSRSFLRCC